MSEQVGEPGDLGRRVRERRHELGLTRDEVAERAAMDPGYLHYLEQRADAQPSSTTMMHLAAALKTTVMRLQGQGFDRPVGSGQPPDGIPTIEVLDRPASLALIRRGGIGRLSFVTERGPVALPVNFRMLDEDVVFHTGDGSIRASVRSGGRLGLEVDHLDDTLGEGWSVLVTGPSTELRDPDELRRATELGIQSWAGEERPITIRLTGEEITGRQIRRRQ